MNASNQDSFQYKLSTSLTGNYLDLYAGETPAWRQGTSAFFWASNYSANSRMYGPFITATGVAANSDLDRRGGNSIRCIMDENVNMQNISHDFLDEIIPNAGDSMVLNDTRDNKKYQVTKLSDGNVWMTQNLKFTGTTVTPEDTNVESNLTITYGDLASSAGGGDSYTQARIHVGTDTDGSATVWYNYGAASAGTILGSSNAMTATQDICPAGWRMPSYAETTALVSAISTTPDVFSPVTGGHYFTGDITYHTWGFWWTSSASADTLRSVMDYVNGGLAHTGAYRTAGMFIRCVAK